MSDGEGRFQISNVAAGRYRWLAELLAEEWFIRSITLPGMAVATRIGAKTAAKSALLDAGRNGLKLRAGASAAYWSRLPKALPYCQAASNLLLARSCG